MAMDPLEELMLQAYPNPERTGCISAESLKAMAAKTVPRNDPAWEHIWKCSPCFAEFVQFRDARAKRRKWQQLFLWAPVAALLLVAISIGVDCLLLRRPTTPQYDAAVFNFDASPTDRAVRGADDPNNKQDDSKLQRLPAKKVELTIYLPRGSDEGDYQFELLDLDGALRRSSAAHAVIERGLTQFQLVVDLSEFPRGQYAVRARRLPGGSWHMSTVIVE